MCAEWQLGPVPRPDTDLRSFVLAVVILVSGSLLSVSGDIPELSGSLHDVFPPTPDQTTVVPPGEWDTPFSSGLFPPSDVRPCFRPDVPDSQGLGRQVPLPDIDDQFEARIEAKILQKGYTVDVEEYYDYPNNRGMVRRTKAGVSSTWIYDFKDAVSFLIVGSNCWLSDLRQEGFHFLNFTFGDKEGHIGGVAQLFTFGTQYNETFIGGNETVRGIPVNHWTSCIEWKRYDAIFQLDYYFSKPEYSMPSGRRSVPVQAVLRGQTRHGDKAMRTFHHIYDFVFYKPGPIRDTSIFEVPRGSVCTHRSIERHCPDLPDSFQMEVEMVQPQDQVVSLRKYYYDFNLKLSRYDLRPNDKSMADWAHIYGHRSVILIHDYNKGVQYVLDKVSRNCSLSRLTLNTVDADPRINDPSHVIMRHGRDLFDLDQLNFSYQGKRRYREISCQVWAALRVNWPQQGTNTTVEIYFNRDNWTTEAETNSAKQPDIVGLWLTLVDSTDDYVSEWVNHIFSYSAKDPDLKLFDVFDCFSKKEKLDVKFSLQVTYLKLVRRGATYVQQAIHLQVAELTKLHPIRISNIKFEDADRLNTEVTMTILEEAVLEGESVNLDGTITAKQAFELLGNQTNSASGFKIHVEYPDETVEYEIIPWSVTTTQPTMEQESHQCALVSKHLYTSGSMAGLGISMLVLGIVGGAAGMFFHKTNKPLIDIPYRAQD